MTRDVFCSASASLLCVTHQHLVKIRPTDCNTKNLSKYIPNACGFVAKRHKKVAVLLHIPYTFYLNMLDLLNRKRLYLYKKIGLHK